MNANAEAIYRELPFLEKYFKRNTVSTVRVSRVTEEFMALQWFGSNATREHDGYDGHEYSPFGCTNGKIRLFDSNGKLVARLGLACDLMTLGYFLLTVITVMIWWMLFPPPHYMENVYQMLLRRRADASYGAWLSNHGELIVYKAHKGTTMRQWYEEQIAEAQQDRAMKLNTVEK